MKRAALALMIIWLPFTLFASEPIHLSGLLIRPSQNVSHFIFTLSQKTTGRVKYRPDQNQVEIEFAGTIKHFNMRDTVLRDANVQSIDLQETADGALRFVFHVRGSSDYAVRFLPAEESAGVRLQLDIFSVANTVASAGKANANRGSDTRSALRGAFEKSVLKSFNTFSTELQKRNANVTAKTVVSTQRTQPEPPPPPPPTKKPRTYIVVIDAGHGGKDSGALGSRGTKEKDIVLGIAKKLAQKINKQSNMRAVLTRGGDYFVPLRKRLALARKGKADLFVAIHADAYYEKNATGASVYALSQRGASNEAARWLAQQENYSELGGVELDEVADRDPVLRSVLLDLAQTATIQDSMRLGNKVLDALEEISSLHYTHVERAPFVVLKSPDIPSVLVETGFITNPAEEKRLADPAYQDKLSDALSLGISSYIQRYAVKGQ